MNKFFIGLDFSKLTVDASIVSKENPEEVIAYERFKNSTAGAKKLLKWASTATNVDILSEVIFCGEKTGTYSRLYADFMSDTGHFIWLQHAMHIKNGMGDVRGKDDKTDSRRIAAYAARFEDKAVRYVRSADRMRLLKNLLTNRQLLMNALKAIAVNRRENPLALQDPTIAEDACREYEKIEQGIRDGIQELNRLIKEAIMAVEEYRQTFSLLTSMKGVALLNAAALIVFTDNFRNFDFNYRKMATYWGVVPFKNESGTSVRFGTHVSPKCNSWLKALITEAALSATKHDAYLKAYYERLIKRGKPKGIALNNAKNKMIKILVALVRDNKPYDANFHINKAASAA